MTIKELQSAVFLASIKSETRNSPLPGTNWF